jgi:ABC-type nitrate/sulfonate/bicarbonate transport system substrate-binding protein
MASVKILLGNYPHTRPVKDGTIGLDGVDGEFVEAQPLYTAFPRMVRDLEFDVCELPLATYLQAREAGVGLTLLPLVMVASTHHGSLTRRPDAAALTVRQLAGQRVGVRSYAQTTGLWVRGVLHEEHGIEAGEITWVTTEEPHVATCRQPPNVERSAAASVGELVRTGDVVAAVLGPRAIGGQGKGLVPVLPDPQAAAAAWIERHGCVPVNHVVVVREELMQRDPGAVRAVYRALAEAIAATADQREDSPAGRAVAAGWSPQLRACLRIAGQYALQQQLVREAVDVEAIEQQTRGIDAAPNLSTTDLRVRPAAPTRVPRVWTPELLAKVDWRKRAAAEPFRGLSAAGVVRPGLVRLRPSGVDTTAMRTAVENYLGALSAKQRTEGQFAMDDVSWRHWANGARYFLRHGLCLEELDDGLRTKALELIATCLSAYGYTQLIDLLHLNLTIGELRGEPELLNEWLYWFSVYGDPESGQPWGWQLDGHHVNVNCVLVGDQLTFTPTFLGAEPVIAPSGKYAGTAVFRREEALGEQFFTGLTPAQRQRAVIADELPPDLYAGAFRDNLELDHAGLPFGELDPAQRERARDLIGLYVDRAAPGPARVRRADVRGYEDETWFAWIGGTGGNGADESVFYYRVHSPVILIEFEHQAGVMYANDVPTRRHIHTVVRTPNGGDYGADLLRQHHERHHRPQRSRTTEEKA